MSRKPSEQNRRSRNILLVDDEPLILSCLARQLRGHRVFRARDAVTAVGILEVEDVDLVLTDYRMPGDDGVMLLEYVRRKQPHVRRLMMSAAPPMNLAELIHAAVVEQFFSKPFGLSLAAEILDLLQDEPPATAQAGETVRIPPVVENNASMQ